MTDPPDSEEAKTSETLDDWVKQRCIGLSKLYNDVAAGKTPITYITTGLERLDAAGLWELGVLHAVIGHEGDGKTTLIVQAAEAAARAGHHVQLYMPEDPKEMIADRVLATPLGATAFDIRRLKLPNPEGMTKRLVAARAAVKRWAANIIMDDGAYDRKTIIEAMYDRYADHQSSLVGIDYAQLFGSEYDEKSVERVIADLIKRFRNFCRNPTNSKNPPPDKKVAGVVLSQVGGHVKRRGIEQFNEARRNARFDKEGNQRPSAEWIDGFRPLPGDAQWAPTSLGQQCRVVLSLLRPNDILSTMGVSGLVDNVMEVLPIKNNYGKKPRMIRLQFDGAHSRLSDPPKKAE